ncbi:HupE/UreJ family protein [Rhodobacter ferrooxidans]|uniref:HupE/UreJ protein n=1 Tax=Rhodobacter ferrooxidans TaxID=371731 RepID=C8S271_9RHOB|nr:HupE/UreJ family protein [Rhodobacter sp. SW2]EEW24943.1 HupE/UreJ protein [Rhodobacter sp. SW2]
MKKLTLSIALATLAGPALAHTGHGDAFGFAHGLAHPIGGADHLLAMLAVGLWSGFVLPQRFWLGAAAFMAAMVVGAGLAWSGIGLPLVEGGIVASVLVFGVIMLVSRKGQADWMTKASLAAIAVFAALHGQAHATEATGAVALYLGGFLISTAALHITGIVIARMVARSAQAGRVQQALGAAIAAAGAFLMVG